MRLASRKVLLTGYPARRIALLKPSALGDIVHSLPVLTALRRLYPTAHICWIVNRAYAGLLEGHRDLDELLPFDRGALRRGMGSAVRNSWSFVRQLRARRFDLVIDLQGLLRSGLMALASGAPRRIGVADCREGAHLCYTDLVDGPDRERLHAVERCWLVVQALGGGDMPIEFHVPLQPAALDWASATLADCPRPWLVLAAGARWQTKLWPVEYFATLARRTQQQLGGTVLLVGTADDVSRSRAVAVLLSGKVCDLTARSDLPQLAALLSRADVVLANDTGPLHLAAALGRPVVAPYTCTGTRRHGPFRNNHTCVETTVPCRASYLRKCSRMDCHRDLTPDRLWPVLEEVLATCQRRSQSA
jgi:lipopolysaccharide heptosyltransferase I